MHEMKCTRHGSARDRRAPRDRQQPVAAVGRSGWGRQGSGRRPKWAVTGTGLGFPCEVTGVVWN